jgi:hypothetical protein
VLEAVAEMTDGSFTPYDWDGKPVGPPIVEDWTDREVRCATGGQQDCEVEDANLSKLSNPGMGSRICQAQW